jgi:ATP-binding cassette subfamily F protein 3
VLVSHDRHLLRATTEQLLIVADGAVRAFDGDLEDYRESLLKTRPSRVEPLKSVKAPKVEPRRPDGKRIKRLEEKMAKLNARKAEIERRLGDPATYQDAEAVKQLLIDQAYAAKELEDLEAQWLALI